MPHRVAHDAPPPPHWPEAITYLTKPRLSASFPAALIPFLSSPSSSRSTFNPRPIRHPSTVQIKRISQSSHPANGQFGLFTKAKIKENELIIPYLGVIHATLVSESGNGLEDMEQDAHSESDHDLSLFRFSASDPRNPFPGQHVSIGVDAASAGNAGRFVNDYRGVTPVGPNAEFRVGYGEGGESRMEIWSLKGKGGIGKGEEILVSYGKGWWGARI